LNVGTFGANDSNKVIFTKDGKNIMYPATKITYWGFRDSRGFIWRVFQGRIYGVIEHGNIVVYARCFLKQDKKDPNEVVVDAEQIYMSNGYEGIIFGFIENKKETLKQIASWMQPLNKEVSEKLANDSYMLFPFNVNKAFNYIKEFNDSVAKEKLKRFNFKLKVTP